MKILSNAIRWCKLYLLILNNKKVMNPQNSRKLSPFSAENEHF